jgi:hypothetical protein
MSTSQSKASLLGQSVNIATSGPRCQPHSHPLSRPLPHQDVPAPSCVLCILDKQGLFPPQGSNVSTTKGGGKKKTKRQYTVAKCIFEAHPVYGEAFRAAQDPKAKAVWANKIKNRVQKSVFVIVTQYASLLWCSHSLVDKMRAFLKEMGEAGMAITSEDQINMDAGSSLANKRSKY